MRVTIVNPVWDPRAATPVETLDRFTTLTGWAGALAAAGATVTVCQRFPSTGAVDRDGVAYRFVGDYRRPSPPRSMRGMRPFIDAVSASSPDVVHMNGVIFPEVVRALRAALPAHVPIVVQDHGGLDPGAQSIFARAWLRRGLAAADAILVSSLGQIDALRDARLAPDHVLLADVMESSTTLRPLPTDTARRLSGLAGAPACLWVGRLNENKDPLTVLDGLSRVFADDPRAALTMVYGEAGLERDVRAMVADTPSLRGRVHLAGAVPHAALAAWYSAADLFVLGSHHEGSGYAAIEALACGAVPAVTDIAPFRALTDDGGVGALWTPGDAGACADAVRRVLRRPLPAQRAAAQARFARWFTWEAIGTRALSIYRDVMRVRARDGGASTRRIRSATPR